MDASFYGFPHAADARRVQEGSTLFEVQNVLGHSAPTMTQRYAHLQPDHLRRAVKPLDRRLGSPKTCNTSPKTSE